MIRPAAVVCESCGRVVRDAVRCTDPWGMPAWRCTIACARRTPRRANAGDAIAQAVRGILVALDRRDAA